VAKYREHFRLSPADIEVIEQAIRAEIAVHARVERHQTDFDLARRRISHRGV
jgi:hypothetical protein